MTALRGLELEFVTISGSSSSSRDVPPQQFVGPLPVLSLAVNKEGLVAVSQVSLHMDDDSKTPHYLHHLGDVGDPVPPAVTSGSEIPYEYKVDPSWTADIVSVELGSLAVVGVAWAPRGSSGVQYLLSWVEQSGSVSGHLLTDQVSSELSLWPGQAYCVQVALVDSHGNVVLRSLGTPLIFESTSSATISTTKIFPAYLTIFQCQHNKDRFSFEHN
ncbi:uncharacterized protein [Cherax quadricarinatus]|uniref:uncharacterized protein n=1 Tax=Cherax quadricarinatus TaxID=27406 RepID=UPI00387E4FB0